MPTAPAFRPALALPILLGLAGCDRLDPEGAAHREYVARLHPLLAENTFLAERVLQLAAQVYNDEGKSDGTALGAAWNADVVPLAQHLHAQAGLVVTPDTWRAAHDDLVMIWGDRAQAYLILGESLVTADDTEWGAAREQADKVKLAEENWFRSANQRLSTKGLSIEQFP